MLQILQHAVAARAFLDEVRRGVRFAGARRDLQPGQALLDLVCPQVAADRRGGAAGLVGRDLRGMRATAREQAVEDRLVGLHGLMRIAAARPRVDALGERGARCGCRGDWTRGADVATAAVAACVYGTGDVCAGVSAAGGDAGSRSVRRPASTSTSTTTRNTAGRVMASVRPEGIAACQPPLPHAIQRCCRPGTMPSKMDEVPLKREPGVAHRVRFERPRRLHFLANDLP
jgi:hypothetical protein